MLSGFVLSSAAIAAKLTVLRQVKTSKVRFISIIDFNLRLPTLFH
jgi:hypothetical protein